MGIMREYNKSIIKKTVNSNQFNIQKDLYSGKTHKKNVKQHCNNNLRGMLTAVNWKTVGKICS